MADDESGRRALREADLRAVSALVVNRLVTQEPGLTPGARKLLVSVVDAGIRRAVDEDAEPGRLTESLLVLEAAVVEGRTVPTLSTVRGPMSPDSPAPRVKPLDERELRDVLARICPLWPFC